MLHVPAASNSPAARAETPTARAGTGLGRTAENLGPQPAVVRGGGAFPAPGPTFSRRPRQVTDAADTGLSDSSADVVIGEAMLTGQGGDSTHDRRGGAAEAGYYAFTNALVPDDVAEQVRTDLSLARALKVNARPLTLRSWSPLSGPWTGRRTRCHRFHGVILTATGDR